MKRTFLIYPAIVTLVVSFLATACKKEEPAKLSVLSTISVDNVTATSATTGGSITSDGGATITASGVCWGISENPTISDSKTSENTGTGQFVSTITGLNGGTTYHVRAYATNVAGTAYGSDVSFLTLGEAPAGVTLATSNLTATGVTLNGTVNPNFLSTTVSFEYGTTTNYGQTAVVPSSPVNGNNVVNVSVNISGLMAGTVYHFRLKTVNSLGTVFGSDMSFTTLGGIPTGTTQAATNITGSGATLNGIINANYLSTTVTFEYGTTTSYGSSATATQSPVTGSTNTNVSASITGLTLGATYHFRVKGVNSLGTLNGNDLSFTTLNVPTLTTKTPTNVTYNAAKTGGNITSDGGAAVTARGVCWSTSGNPTIALTTKTSDGTGIGTFSSSITGLTPNTTYYIRAYATNSVGTSYGSQITLTTTVAPPTNGLIAYYPFNGNANDESGNNINGVVSNATLSTDRFNAFNKAYSFDGIGDYIKIPDNELFNSDNITVSMWAKVEKQNANTPDLFMINKRGNSFSEEQWRIYHQGTSPTTDSISLVGDAFSITGGRFIANKIVITQVWHNILMTINGSQIDLYVNGKLMKSTPISGTLRKTNYGVTIGARIINGIVQSYYFGQIDDVRFYNRVVTNDEIQALYHEDGW